MESCHALCMELLIAFAIDMGLDEDYFTSRHAFGGKQLSMLRLLYYPAINVSSRSATGNKSSDTALDDIRAGAHSDYGTCTLLFQKDVGGLQILASMGDETKWIDVPVIEDTVIVNIGDAFDFWTDGKFKSTLHRVVIPETMMDCQSRFSIAYFLHPEDSVLLEPISCMGGQDGKNNRDGRDVRNRFGIPTDKIHTSKEWLLQRLSSTYGTRKPV